MAPYQAPLSTTHLSASAPPLTRSSTLPAAIPHHRPNAPDRNHLAPEDAIYAHSPPRRPSLAVNRVQRDLRGNPLEASARGARRGRYKDRTQSGSRRKGTWKKLLWVKQSYPDNYTDQETFLEHLQRNPRLLPYDFWPLVADSTVIVQHVCSVIIFIVCFTAIFQERISPVAIVTWGSIGTVLGWLLWDFWMGQEEAAAAKIAAQQHPDAHSTHIGEENGSSGSSTISVNGNVPLNTSRHSHNASVSSIHSTGSTTGNGHTMPSAPYSNYSLYPNPTSTFSPRNQQRLTTLKSSILIYCALLGLSPILKSLTLSTSSDSIWAMSFWLLAINVFFFDYSSSRAAVRFPASLSTNAALMASTVLASRLPSTEHVFSLTLFSIEVFGLFPVFRRHLRHVSWRLHLLLTLLLVTGAGGGVGVIVSGGGWKAGVVGTVVGWIGGVLAMGGCSWWLIGLQRYKNEIHGPWDPARPIIRGSWDF